MQGSGANVGEARGLVQPDYLHIQVSSLLPISLLTLIQFYTIQELALQDNSYQPHLLRNSPLGHGTC